MIDMASPRQASLNSAQAKSNGLTVANDSSWRKAVIRQFDKFGERIT
jgi:hypothetical protein